MQISKTFTDERSGNAAVATETVAHARVLVGDALARWNSVELPDASTLADPALLAVSGSNPDSSLLATVVYAKSPLGLELVDIFVGDADLTERVYDHEVIVVEHELGANPEQGCTDCNSSAEAVLDPFHGVVNGVENYLRHEQRIKNDGNYGPGEVAFGSEDECFIHASIIAGITAVQEGK